MAIEQHAIDTGVNQNFYSNAEELTIWNLDDAINLTVSIGQKSFTIKPNDSFTDGFTNNLLFKLAAASSEITVQLIRTIPINRENSGSW